MSSKFNPLIFTISNGQYMEFTKNWILNLHKNDLYNYLIVCTDIDCYNHLKQWQFNIATNKIRLLDINTLETINIATSINNNNDTNTTNVLKYGSSDFKHFVLKRASIVKLLYLEMYNQWISAPNAKSNTNALFYMDADTGIINKTFVSLIQNVYSSYDVILQIDNGNHMMICTCMIFIPFNVTHHENVIKWVDQWIFQCSGHVHSDQGALNMALKELGKEVNIAYLKTNEFPAGKYMKIKKWRNMYWPDSIYIIHANWLRGFQDKKNFLKKYGTWFLD